MNKAGYFSPATSVIYAGTYFFLPTIHKLACKTVTQNGKNETNRLEYQNLCAKPKARVTASID